MKHIVKQAEPQALADWKAAHSGARYKDLYDESSYPGATAARRALRQALRQEQRDLCCYCEVRIDSGDFHVEHFRPKDATQFPHLQLDYNNLHACCHRLPTGDEEEHCGHHKGNDFSEALVSPLEPDCASHFRYDLAGNIFGTDERGRVSVAMLKLDSKLLVRSRKGLIEEFEDMDDDEYAGEIANHLNPSASPSGEFFTMVEHLHNAGLLH